MPSSLESGHVVLCPVAKRRMAAVVLTFIMLLAIVSFPWQIARAISAVQESAVSSSDPVDFGADPSGVRDSSDAIEQCIQANKGGSVSFSTGTYAISRPICTPHSANERISIYFNGATLMPLVKMDCLLDIGGLEPLESGDAGIIRTFFKDATFKNYENLAETGIKVKPYYKDAVIEDCNVLGFRRGVEVSSLGVGKPSDTQITGCLLRYSDVSDEESYGVAYYGSDNKITDCFIIGFHYSIYLHSSALFASNVHNLPKGLTRDYPSDLSGSAFLYANGGFVLTNCYCDTYETFVEISNNVNGKLNSCTMYSYKTPMKMQLVKFSNEETFTGQILLNGVYYSPRPSPIEGERNSSVVLSADDDKEHLFRSGIVIRDCVLGGNFTALNENLHALDMLSSPFNNNPLPSYRREIELPTNKWVPLCAFLLTPARASTLSFRVRHYKEALPAVDVSMLIRKGEDRSLSVFPRVEGDSSFPLQLGYSFTYDDAQGFYGFVIWCKDEEGPLLALSSIENLRCDCAMPVDIWNSPTGSYHEYDERLLDDMYLDVESVVPFYPVVE